MRRATAAIAVHGGRRRGEISLRRVGPLRREPITPFSERLAAVRGLAVALARQHVAHSDGAGIQCDAAVARWLNEHTDLE